jgi:putative Holliday junction resolvase
VTGEAEKPAVPPFPATGRLLGIDHGLARIGLAVCDVDRRISSPLDTYTRRNSDLDAAYFASVVRAEAVGGAVVGLPVHTNGQEGKQAAECRRFAAWFVQVTGLPVTFWDERFSTTLAEDALWGAGLSHKRRKARRDRVAAQIILQSFLEAGCPTERHLFAPPVEDRPA